MKFTTTTALLAGSVAALPSPTENGPVGSRTIQKRATITDACDVGYCTENGGTTGGAGGATTTVSTLAQFTEAAESDDPMVIVVEGAIEGATKVRLGSDKTIVGAKGSSLKGCGLQISKVSNIIIRNMKIFEVEADYGDAINIQESQNVWIDHNELSSNLDHDKDFYDGLCDVTHASDYVTISNNYFHDHWKASLVGHSDNNGDEDKGHLTVTYDGNWWQNINSRAPSFRFGTGHIMNSYFENLIDSGINARLGAQLLIESSVFEDCNDKAIFFDDSDETGYAVVRDVDLGGSTNSAPEGTLTEMPYEYTLLGSENVKSSVTSNAGQTLSF
ncbi:pectate lyase [Xylariomycetidae sp. FL0641]|nr:pectate lyase [Xylariomycetidae sp. FL0641]